MTNLRDVNLLGWVKERIRRPSYYLNGNRSLKGWWQIRMAVRRPMGRVKTEMPAIGDPAS